MSETKKVIIPTWEAACNVLMTCIECGTKQKAIHDAKNEILRLARFVDKNCDTNTGMLRHVADGLEKLTTSMYFPKRDTPNGPLDVGLDMIRQGGYVRHRDVAEVIRYIADMLE